MMSGDGPVPRTARLLPPPPAVVALTGGGGKTTLLYTLGGYLHRQGRLVLLSTTTRVYPPEPDEAVLWTGREPPHPQYRGGVPRLWGAGTDAAGKVVGVDPSLFRSAAAACDYLLVEADGSRGLPLKTPLPAAGGGRSGSLGGGRGEGIRFCGGQSSRLGGGDGFLPWPGGMSALAGAGALFGTAGASGGGRGLLRAGRPGVLITLIIDYHHDKAFFPCRPLFLSN
ncbi:selenium cofactor biosynthesis protein YqeC [Desulfotomaculum copahuensis]|uniref:Selenium-dependent hydroxylase accessory protein YqeC n=1 Tax=Desulfotomaculum copahuensis TaxID=1838280 RepID=A0A1B7LIT7_9FIRM|nr:selenium cofactor biosynthesis protein YqeC [Desulfotomaculum copahuensis]OAT86485.1 hypothetical protein A6M21_03440 [Desulfotomaculum copahuensis]